MMGSIQNRHIKYCFREYDTTETIKVHHKIKSNEQ